MQNIKNKPLRIEIGLCRENKDTIIVEVYVESEYNQPVSKNLNSISLLLTRNKNATKKDFLKLAKKFPEDSLIIQELANILSTGTIEKVFGPWWGHHDTDYSILIFLKR